MNEANENVKQNSDSTNHACLSSETHAYEVEFIKTYEQQSLLWDVNHQDYTNKYKRGFALDALLKIIKKWDNNATRNSVRQKINVLRSCYRKDLRKHLASKTIGPDGEEIYEHNPKSWKFLALRFLGGKVGDEDSERIKNNSIEELNLDTTTFEEGSEESGNDEPLSHTSDMLQNSLEGKVNKPNQCNQERNKRKHVKLEVQDYIVDDNMLDREFEAIGSNVVCKLRRMNPDQRYHAELLINKVLITGLKNNLTDDTDLTEVYK